MSVINSNFRIGFLGGGQLGKMLSLAAQDWDLKVDILDKHPSFPAGSACSRFITGDFRSFEDVLQFGRQVDLLSIEIEHVNTEALHELVAGGKKVHPHPKMLDIIKDKLLQKEFYKSRGLPTSVHRNFENSEEIKRALQQNIIRYPFVQKSRTAGYDGRGVSIIHHEKDLVNLLPVPSIVEPLVDIQKEIAVIVARNESGQVSAFPPVEMEFNPTANLVEMLLCPAALTAEQIVACTRIAVDTIKAYQLCGLLAVELFLTRNGEWMINEVAPRPHNSGHHTIESCYTSQFKQHLRAILNWPLGSTKMISPAVMINLLGEAGYNGQAIYQGVEECLTIPGVNVHLYGKTMTKPFRKMGHATILAENLDLARENAQTVKKKLKIIA